MASTRKGGARSAQPQSPAPKVKKLPTPKKPKIRPAALKRPILLHEQVANSFDTLNEAHRTFASIRRNAPAHCTHQIDAMLRRIAVQLRMLQEVIDADADCALNDDAQGEEIGGAA